MYLIFINKKRSPQRVKCRGLIISASKIQSEKIEQLRIDRNDGGRSWFIGLGVGYLIEFQSALQEFVRIGLLS